MGQRPNTPAFSLRASGDFNFQGYTAAVKQLC